MPTILKFFLFPVMGICIEMKYYVVHILCMYHNSQQRNIFSDEEEDYMDSSEFAELIH